MQRAGTGLIWLWLHRLAVLALLAGLALGALVPMYTDEIGWRFQERAWLDGGIDSAMSDICGPNTLAHAPAFMLPVRWFSATMNLALADPALVRATGVALALVLAALFWRLTTLLAPAGERRRLLQACTFGLLACGILPLVLVLSRPEQPVILGVMAMLLLALSGKRDSAGARTVWLKSLAIVVICTVALSYHLKGVLYSPFALACLAVLAPWPRHLAPRLLAALAIVVLDVLAAQYWIARFQCPADPVAAATMAEQNVAALIASHQGIGPVLLTLLGNANIIDYVSLLALDATPMSAWYPAGQFTRSETDVTLLFYAAVWLCATLVAAVSLIDLGRRDGWRALVRPRVLLLVMLAGTTVVWGASQLIKNDYEVAHMLPAWIVVLVLALSLDRSGAIPAPRMLRGLAVLLVASALASQAMLVARLGPPMWAATHDSGRLPGQPFSVALGGYDTVRADIAAAMRGAGLDQGQRLERPMLDDVTYLALQRSHLPLHYMGVVGHWRGSISDPAAYLASRRSDGIVVACDNLWRRARALASRSGEICAIGAQGLAQLAGGRPFPAPAAD